MREIEGDWCTWEPTGRGHNRCRPGQSYSFRSNHCSLKELWSNHPCSWKGITVKSLFLKGNCSQILVAKRKWWSNACSWKAMMVKSLFQKENDVHILVPEREWWWNPCSWKRMMVKSLFLKENDDGQTRSERPADTDRNAVVTDNLKSRIKSYLGTK